MSGTWYAAVLAFLGREWGSLLSLVGLCVGFVAAFQAKRAREAAQQAREAAHRGSLAEDMATAMHLASDLLGHVVAAQGALASIRATDLIGTANYLLRRWDRQLTRASRNALIAASNQLNEIHDVLARNPFPAQPSDEFGALVQACRVVSTTFAAEHGAAMKLGE